MARTEGNILLLIMPGLDPGTAATAGIDRDRRVKPGDDDRGYDHLVPMPIGHGTTPTILSQL
jgi:hypothetical protein